MSAFSYRTSDTTLIRRTVESEIQRSCRKLDDWNTRLTAYSLALARGNIEHSDYRVEVRQWQKQLVREVADLSLKCVAVACDGQIPTHNPIFKFIDLRNQESSKQIGELARLHLESSASEIVALGLTHQESKPHQLMWEILEWFDEVRRVWDESKHPRDERGRFVSTGGIRGKTEPIVNSAKVGPRLNNLDFLPPPDTADPFGGPFESIPQAEARLRVAGVPKVNLGSDLRVANATVRVIEETARRTGKAPDEVIIDASLFDNSKDEEEKQAQHVYDPATRKHTIRVNPDAIIFSAPGKFPEYYMERIHKRGRWYSTADPFHIIDHEMGHMLHAESNKKLFLKYEKQGFPEEAIGELKDIWPSEYSKETPYEFVAEVYCLKLHKQEIHPVIQKWYKKLGGWEL